MLFAIEYWRRKAYHHHALVGRYFYDFDAPWVDIDDKKAPSVAPWMVPDNWRNGQRPSGKAAASSPPAGQTASSSNSTVTSSRRNGNGNGSSAPPSATSNNSRQNGSSNGSSKTGVKPEGTAAQSQSGSQLDQRIATLEETVGIKLYRWVLREY